MEKNLELFWKKMDVKKNKKALFIQEGFFFLESACYYFTALLVFLSVGTKILVNK